VLKEKEIAMAVPFAGGCMCGAARYEVNAEPLAFMLCHCRECQYVSGGEPAAVVIVPKAAITLKQGTLKGFTSTAESGNTVTRKFCPECGTPVFSEPSANPDLGIIKAGSMDDASWLKPGAILWRSSAQPWAHIDSALPTFEKNPG